MVRRALWLIVGLVIVVGAVGFVLGPWASAPAPVEQPLAFNHKAHVDMGMDCVDCHTYVKTQTFSGLPTLETCLGCHAEAITESPEEEKVRTAAAAGTELHWNRLYHVPNHVYYSHRRHVTAGGLECATCHGPIAQTERPPKAPLNAITMDFCIDCHQRNEVTVDCIACHK